MVLLSGCDAALVFTAVDRCFIGLFGIAGANALDPFRCRFVDLHALALKDDCGLGELGTDSYIGRVARQMGLRFGKDGLSMLLSSEDGTRVRISTDRDLTLEFLGFDPKAHRAGFDTPEAIYDFIATGRYFDPAIYEMDRMTNRAKSRSRTRPFYKPFINAIRQRPALHIWPELCTPAGMATWRERAFDVFPGSREAHHAIVEAQARARATKAFFCGDRVSELTGITGSRLSHLMNEVRKQFPTPEAFHTWSSNQDEEDLRARLRAVQAA